MSLGYKQNEKYKFSLFSIIISHKANCTDIDCYCHTCDFKTKQNDI